jgi:uncharacterized protein YqeY
MSLTQKIDQDLKAAMIAKDETKLSTLRFLKSAIKYSAIEKKVDSLSDADIQQVIQKQVKQRKESIDQFSKNSRADLADKEIAETRVLESYLPKQMADAELAAVVEAEVKAQGASSKKDFGRMMKHLGDKLQGQADSRRVSEALGKFLQ